MRRALPLLILIAAACREAPPAPAPEPAPLPPPVQAGPTPRQVPYVATPQSIVQEMLDLANVGPADVVYDLGSGDGRIVIAAARRGARGVGIDIDPVLVEAANEAARREALSSRADFRVGDVFQADVSPATVVTMYLMHSINLRLRPGLLAHLKPGTRIVSHTFDLGDWEADKVVANEIRQLYLWVVPANVSGTWEWMDGATRMTLTLDQSYQKVKGTLAAGTTSSPLAQVRLTANRLSFVAEVPVDGRTVRTIFTGVFRGDKGEGTMAPDATPGTSRPWRPNRVPGTAADLAR